FDFHPSHLRTRLVSALCFCPLPSRLVPSALTRFSLPAVRSLRDRSGVLDAWGIVAALAQLLGLPGLARRRRPVAPCEREPCELDSCTAVDPGLRISRCGTTQIGQCRFRPAERGARGASFVHPERLFAGHSRAAIALEHLQTVAEQLVRLCPSAGPE